MESLKIGLPPPRQLAASKGSMQQRIRKRTEEMEVNLVNVVHTLPACCRCRTVCLQPPLPFRMICTSPIILTNIAGISEKLDVMLVYLVVNIASEAISLASTTTRQRTKRSQEAM